MLHCLYNHGIWIYKVFEILPIGPRLCYITFNYLTGACFYYLFNVLQRWRWGEELTKSSEMFEEDGLMEHLPRSSKENDTDEKAYN